MKGRYRIQSGFRASVLGRMVFQRWFYVALGVAVLAGAGLFGGRWVYSKWMNRQSWKFAVDAADYRSKGRVSEALMSAKTSLRLNPENPSALRELALLAPLHVPAKEGLEAWQRLDRAGGLTRADALAYAMLAGSESEWALANLILDRLGGLELRFCCCGRVFAISKGTPPVLRRRSAKQSSSIPRSVAGSPSPCFCSIAGGMPREDLKFLSIFAQWRMALQSLPPRH